MQRDIFVERALQHSWCPVEWSWVVRPVLIRLEKIPFGHGASRQAYRLKYIATSDIGSICGTTADWEQAEEHVVKCYNTKDGSIQAEDDDAHAFEFAMLQHEAARWAHQFNSASTAVVELISCTVLQLTAREQMPVVSCERFLSGGAFGAPFAIYSSDTLQTPAAADHIPLAYFLFSFYSSGGLSMVVHMEGIGSTFTNPQVS